MTSKIEWTDKSVGAAALGLYGCSHAGPGCRNCWAEKMASRWKEQWGIPPGIVVNGRWTGTVDALTGKLHLGFRKMPGPRSKVRRVFPFNTGDLFHEDVPDKFICIAFMHMSGLDHLTFQVLTKRPARTMDWIGSKTFPHCWGRNWPANIHIGASCSTQADVDRLVPDLLKVPAKVRFLSLEPLLGPLSVEGFIESMMLNNVGTDIIKQETLGWVIVGAESGPRRRPCKLEWAKDIVDMCRDAHVPVFMKQLDLDGRLSKDPEEWPEWARVQEFPR